jgi:hypothetical protein
MVASIIFYGENDGQALDSQWNPPPAYLKTT